MTERNEVWEKMLEERLASDPRFAVISTFWEPSTFNDALQREMDRVASDFNREFFVGFKPAGLRSIIDPEQEYAAAFDEYLENGVPKPKVDADPERPWWEMSVDEIE